MNSYRHDIDGLRGICVLAVVVFHVFPSLAPGGFLGVDIFFGISGYLICQLILRQLLKQEFSFFGFFASRIRRIFPALLLILLFCAIIANKLLPFDEFRLLNLHLATSTVFSSNFLLANEVGYFDTASIRKPLLHLWSLAVEEQFYIVFPFLILFAYSLKRQAGVSMLLAFFSVASYIVGTYTATSNSNAAYYLPWCRAYEILIGAALASSEYLFVHSVSAANQMKYGGTQVRLPYQTGRLLFAKDFFAFYSGAWSIIGMGLIVFSFYIFNPNDPIPGVSTLFPLLGLLILLAVGPRAWVNRYVLSTPILVKLGKISYPLYLWHWPVWVFLTIKFHDTVLMGVLAIVVSTLLATMTYQFVERPIRNGRLMVSKTYVLLLLMVIAGMVSLRTYEMGVFRIEKNQLALDQATLAQYQQITNQVDIKYQWTADRKKVIIFGDSQAQDLFNAWKNSTSVGLMMANSAYFCSAFRYPDKDQTRHAEYCNKQFDQLTNSEEIKQADVFVYTHFWRDRDEFVPGYTEGVDRIRKANPKLKIYFMGPKPIIWKSYVSINAIMHDYKAPQDINEYLNSVRYDNSHNANYVRGLADHLNVGYIDAINILCQDKCDLYSGTEHYYYDQSHWTPAGTLNFYNKAALTLSQLVNKNGN
jgi:peptidoglycan/LPS O-acetylase OafA/YrhL